MRILLEAPIFTRSGYGEHARLVYRSLAKLPGAHIYTNALEWGFTSWTYANQADLGDMKASNEKYLMNEAKCKAENIDQQFDMQIHVGIPSEFNKKANYSVCVTAGIETDRVSYNWLSQTHKGIDKLIVPSEHAAAGFRSTNYEVINKTKQTESVVSCNCPVEVVPYPVKSFEPADLGLNLETEFNFLTVALLGHRKNIESSIKWFVGHFKDNPNVGLVLKTSTARASILDREKTKSYLKSLLSELGPRSCKIYLLHGDLTEAEVHSLYTHPKIKAYMTTTRGEGYGLPIFEAAYSGMPIIATDWSGHLDFLSADFKENGKTKQKKLFARVDYSLQEVSKEAVWEGVIEEGSRWAEPTEKSFTQQIEKVYKNYGMYKKWANVLKESLQTTHSQENVLAQMTAALVPKELEEQLTKQQEWAAALSEIEIL